MTEEEYVNCCPSEEEMDEELKLYLAEKYELWEPAQAEKALKIYKQWYAEGQKNPE